MRLALPFIILFLAAGAHHSVAGTPAHTPVVGLPCEGCDAALAGMPAQPASSVQLAPPGEPGEPLRLTGIVRDAAQRPRAGVIVYAYQTDHTGIYPAAVDAPTDAARQHGRLRAWAATDAGGAYTFHTIRPGSYPDSDMPQHIHLHVIEPGCATYYIDDVMFSDDPHLTPRFARELDIGRGGHGIVTPTRRDGVWEAQRDIVLGRNIDGYRDCTPQRDGPTP
ncbi:hypothetical protein [Chiayiivirga flava]|uniref:Protocatechuate 3,4-dioxygenase beta subunit n=1 Tax=Chiayiivirga flava TaxID=659595 RepID=A0A7W8G266_9GAMM|nr:hypothetical protein [Chiayiivirga flava]MBB5208370.1 protocatechuate 3,4-dioxygenase beta subunit [Chiayiivirga flava]